MKKNFKIIKVLVLLVAVLGAWFGYREYNRKPANMESMKSDFLTTTATLLGAFEENEAQANQQYLDKVVEVEGAVRAINQDEAGLYTVMLGNDGSLSSVRCSVDGIFSAQAGDLQPGSSVTVRGVCAGFMADSLLGSDVTLVRCTILKK